MHTAKGCLIPLRDRAMAGLVQKDQKLASYYEQIVIGEPAGLTQSGMRG